MEHQVIEATSDESGNAESLFLGPLASASSTRRLGSLLWAEYHV